jgi:hypothetical protein
MTLTTGTGPLFLAAEIEVYQPASGVDAAPAEAHGVLAHGTLSVDVAVIEDTATVRASDVGYVTRETDDGGLQVYPPILASGVELDRAMDLSPAGQGAAAGWGSLRLANEAGVLTTLGTTRNADGRAVRLRLGRKTPMGPGLWRDPPLADTVPVLAGIAAGWSVDEVELRLQLRDPTYWLERLADGATYAGTGGLDGTAALAGKRKPRLRGGSATDPVREIAPVLVDPSAGIYQISDAEGAIVALYERGLAGGITFNASVADITAAAPPSATYDVETSTRGLFLRLGTFPPAGQITVDAWGAFPDATTPSIAAEVALGLLEQDLAVPPAFIASASFAALATDAPWAAGVFLGVDEALDGVQVVGELLRSSAARLVPSRDGRLTAVALAPVPAGTLPVAAFTTAQIVSCVPRPLGPPLSPPPFRMRVAWGRNFTTQTSDLAPTLSGARRQELAEPWRVAAAASTAVGNAWRRPSDPPLVETALTNGTDAAALATLLRDLWCVPQERRLYDVAIPLPLALARDLGDVVSVTYPGPLAQGRVGRIVGEQIRTIDDVATIQVLV